MTDLVHSLARPGGNLTGLSTLALGLEEKRLELIKEFKSGTRRVAVLWDPDNPYSALATRQIMAAAPLLGVEITLLRVVEAADLDSAFAALALNRLDALLVPAYLVLVAERERIVKFAATQPIGDPMFEIGGLQLLGQGCHFVDGATTIVGDG